jgi:hypothetical protein
MTILDELNLYYESEDYLYEMASIGGKSTGLPMSLFFSPQPQNHKIRPIRFKVSDNPKKFLPNESLVYSIIENEDGEPMGVEPLTDKRLSTREEKLLAIFIILNYNAILSYWNSELHTDEFISMIQKVGK